MSLRRNLKPQIEAMVAQGVSSRTIARRLGCNLSYVELLHSYVHHQSALSGGDSSTPKFAHDDDHVALVVDHGGFCALSERRDAKGNVYVCLPVIWPMRERAA